MNHEVGMGSHDSAFREDKPTSQRSYSVRVPEHPLNQECESRGPLYDIHRDVICRQEVLPEEELARFIKVIFAALAIGIPVLISLATLKAREGLEQPTEAKVYNYINTAVATGCFVATFTCTVCYIVRNVLVTGRGFRWSERRKKQMVLNVMQQIAQTLNTFFYLLPNVMVIAFPSKLSMVILQWFRIIRFTMWNVIFLLFVLRAKMLNPWVDSSDQMVGSQDAILMDAPWTQHWLLFLVWATIQAVIIGLSLRLQQQPIGNVCIMNADKSLQTCNIPSEYLWYAGVVTGSLLIFQIIGTGYIYRAYKRLQRRSYNLFRTVNVALRYHFLHAATIGDFVTLSMILLFWVEHDSFGTGSLALLGFLPPQLVMTVLTAVNCIIAMPVKPGRTVTLSMQTNYFEWLETPSETTRNELRDPRVDNKFCFELSVKLWYWSLAVYAFDPATQECHDPQYPLLTFPVAMSMFGFQHHEFIAEKGSDTRILMAWNDHTILVCFRGTYSATNVWSDLQFWRVVHPPKRGSYFMRSQPLVHRGFLACWEHSQLNHRIVSLVRRIMDGAKFDRSRLRVLVTGHSLGGALAVLASHELATSCGIGSQITCYTYGAPRVGNHAFVREYNVRVPNTWQVINDVDLIPSVPKFVLLFKHVGERVIINGAGDMIVKPHAVEVSLYRVFGFFKRSIRIMHHLLLSYRASFVAICEAQYKHGKALEGGKEAMDILLGKREKVLSAGLDVDIKYLRKLHSLGSQVWTGVKNGTGRGNNSKNTVNRIDCNIGKIHHDR